MPSFKKNAMNVSNNIYYYRQLIRQPEFSAPVSTVWITRYGVSGLRNIWSASTTYKKQIDLLFEGFDLYIEDLVSKERAKRLKLILLLVVYQWQFGNLLKGCFAQYDHELTLIGLALKRVMTKGVVVHHPKTLDMWLLTYLFYRVYQPKTIDVEIYTALYCFFGNHTDDSVYGCAESIDHIESGEMERIELLNIVNKYRHTLS